MEISVHKTRKEHPGNGELIQQIERAVSSTEWRRLANQFADKLPKEALIRSYKARKYKDTIECVYCGRFCSTQSSATTRHMNSCSGKVDHHLEGNNNVETHFIPFPYEASPENIESSDSEVSYESANSPLRLRQCDDEEDINGVFSNNSNKNKNKDNVNGRNIHDNLVDETRIAISKINDMIEGNQESNVEQVDFTGSPTIMSIILPNEKNNTEVVIVDTFEENEEEKEEEEKEEEVEEEEEEESQLELYYETTIEDPRIRTICQRENITKESRLVKERLGSTEISTSGDDTDTSDGFDPRMKRNNSSVANETCDKLILNSNCNIECSDSEGNNEYQVPETYVEGRLGIYDKLPSPNTYILGRRNARNNEDDTDLRVESDDSGFNEENLPANCNIHIHTEEDGIGTNEEQNNEYYQGADSNNLQLEREKAHDNTLIPINMSNNPNLKPKGMLPKRRSKRLASIVHDKRHSEKVHTMQLNNSNSKNAERRIRKRKQKQLPVQIQQHESDEDYPQSTRIPEIPEDSSVEDESAHMWRKQQLDKNKNLERNTSSRQSNHITRTPPETQDEQQHLQFMPETPLSKEELSAKIANAGKGLFTIHHSWKRPFLLILTQLLEVLHSNPNSNLELLAVFSIEILPGLITSSNVKNKKNWMEEKLINDLPEETIKNIVKASSTLSDVQQAKSKRKMTAMIGQRNAAKLLKEGRIGKLMSKLRDAVDKEGGQSVFRGTESEIKSRVLELNPENEMPIFQDIEHSNTNVPFPIIEKENLRKIIESLPRQSANGTSSWTFSLIRELADFAAQGENVDGFYEALAKFMCKIINGQLTSDSYYVLSTSRQVLLDNGTKIRPIGIGNAFIRIAGKLALHECNKELNANLNPIQMCAGVKGGCEIVGAISQAKFDNNLVQVSLDGKNAFNTISREAVAKGICKYCPRLLPFFKACYGSKTELRSSTEMGMNRLVGFSYTGVRQGDPLGMAYFALGVHDTLLELNTLIQTKQNTMYDMYEENLHLGRQDETEITEPSVIAYADDITLSAPVEVIGEILEQSMEIYSKNLYPLQLNISKTVIYGKQVNQIFRNNILDQSPLYRDHLVKAKFLDEGTKVVGIPVGTPSFISSDVMKSMEELEVDGKAIKAANIPIQMKYLLLKYSTNSKPWYLVRNISPIIGKQGFIAFDKMIDKTIEMITGSELGVMGSILRGQPYWAGGIQLPRTYGPAGAVAFMKRKELVMNFLREQDLNTTKQNLEQVPDPILLSEETSLGVFTDELHNDLELLNHYFLASMEDEYLTSFCKLDTIGWKPLERQTWRTTLNMAHRILSLRLLSHMIKVNLVEIESEEAREPASEYIKIHDIQYKFVQSGETKSKIAWLLASLSDGEKVIAKGGFRTPKWNTGGLLLNYTGKYGKGSFGDQEFRAYLSSRLLLPYISRHMACHIHPACQMNTDLLHPLLCRGVGKRNWSKGRHNRMIVKLLEIVKETMKVANPETIYEGRRIGQVTVKVGEEDTRYNAAGKRVVPDLVLYLNTSEPIQRPYAYDLTCRDSHARRFITTNPLQRVLLKQGQATDYARAEKERIYEGAHTPGEAECVTLGFESNGFVSAEVHDFLIFLLQLGLRPHRINRFKQDIAECIGLHNGLAIVDAYTKSYEAEIQGDGHRVNENNGNRVNFQRATQGSECGFAPEDGRLNYDNMMYRRSSWPSALSSSSSQVGGN